MKAQRWIVGVGCAGLLVGLGCSTFVGAVADSAANSAGEHVGNSMGDSVGNQMAAQYTPMMARAYTRYLMAVAFGAGGYGIQQTGYEVGEWTRWRMPGNADETAGTGEQNFSKYIVLERAYLAREADGTQWWKVKLTDQHGKVILMEALFSADRTQLLRLRAKFPNDAQGKEIPVEENTGWIPPHHLTKQSLEGAFQGRASVSVPAGTFRTRHYQYGNMSGGTLQWWMAKSVPGGAVKFVEQGGSTDGSGHMNPNAYQMELVAFGHGATSELGTKI